jgi:ribosome-associated protein
LAIPEDELWFTAARSSGPGGQHVNTTCSRATLHFDLRGSPSLSDAQKSLAAQRLGRRVDTDGILRLSVQTTRSQHANKELAKSRFAALLAEALRVLPERRQSKVPKAVKNRVVEQKRRRGMVKRERRDNAKEWDGE